MRVDGPTQVLKPFENTWLYFEASNSIKLRQANDAVKRNGLFLRPESFLKAFVTFFLKVIWLWLA